VAYFRPAPTRRKGLAKLVIAASSVPRDSGIAINQTLHPRRHLCGAGSNEPIWCTSIRSASWSEREATACAGVGASASAISRRLALTMPSISVLGACCSGRSLPRPPMVTTRSIIFRSTKRLGDNADFDGVHAAGASPRPARRSRRRCSNHFGRECRYSGAPSRRTGRAGVRVVSPDPTGGPGVGRRARLCDVRRASSVVALNHEGPPSRIMSRAS